MSNNETSSVDTQNNDGDKYVPQPVLNVLRSKFFGANMSPDHTPKDRRKNPSRFNLFSLYPAYESDHTI